MGKVEMMVFGRTALVDADMAAKMTKKEVLVNKALQLQAKIATGQVGLKEELMTTMGKINRLNRTIRRTVKFL